MKTTFKTAIALAMVCILTSCGGKQTSGNNREVENDRALAESKRISDSLALVYAEKEKERLAAEEKKKLGHNIGDTIPFGSLQIVVHEVEKRKVDAGSNARYNSVVGKGKPFGVMMKVSITNTGNAAKELPFTYFQEEKRRNNNSYYQEQQMPIWAASRFCYTENKKSLVKDFFIKPGKTMTIWCQATGYGASTTLCFVEKDTAEVDKQLEKMASRHGGEFMAIITEDYNGLLAKVNLKEALQKKTEE
ncbi:hypothetical protein GGR21_002131 [Dysgonomonas hofstadii]|uniref:Uncharacterized protein n=1 Tax=Dysgonomonas hofstadii TaxID=637886 RepID=A0A840CJU9_9BACT|nr:hypothetical protein [Dysgonomonas hofstadii]MBB4036230.1 hypothetical protein [Dysgonomonas hofstadii]